MKWILNIVFAAMNIVALFFAVAFIIAWTA